MAHLVGNLVWERVVLGGAHDVDGAARRGRAEGRLEVIELRAEEGLGGLGVQRGPHHVAGLGHGRPPAVHEAVHGVEVPRDGVGRQELLAALLGHRVEQVRHLLQGEVLLVLAALGVRHRPELLLERRPLLGAGVQHEGDVNRVLGAYTLPLHPALVLEGGDAGLFNLYGAARRDGQRQSEDHLAELHG